jgi:RHS repeat-associated protein
VTYTWDAGNRQTQVVDTQDGTITRAYDALDRLTAETSPRGSVSYGYDANGRRTRLSIPGQVDVTYTYDDADRLTGITKGTDQVSFTYDDTGRRSTLTLPGGIVASYTYDDAGQLTGVVYTRAGITVGDLAYQYDAAGRRTQESGSLVRRAMPGAVSSATYNAANQLTAWGGTALAYDANGNLTSDGSRTYTWDSRNRLKTIAGTATASFAYDAFGRRGGATVSGATTSFLYDGANISQELTGASVKATILGGLGIDEIFRRTDAAGPRTFLTDPLGSALALADDAGVARTQYTYTPYGATTAAGDASSNPFQYTGRENDGTGLYYYRARYYNPSLGRFISQDPLGLGGGINRYAYALSDPINFIDPLGLVSLREILAQIGAVGPIDANTANNLADQSLAAAQNSGLGGLHNGPADAFRHCLWSCLMAQQIGADQAKKVGDLHERYGENPPGETCMDLHNNAQGRGAAGNGDCSSSCMGLLNGGQLQRSPGGTPPGGGYTPY